MKVRTRRRVLALAASMGMAACAMQPRYDRREPAGWPAVAVEVTNRNWMDVVVYAVTSSQLVRLGSVTTGSAQRFELPRSVNTLGGDFYLEARPVGTRQVFRSQLIMAGPGARVIWAVENEPALSTFLIASRN
jgi:hypothetical protein